MKTYITPRFICKCFRIDKLYPKLLWLSISHDDVIKWKHFPRYWPFVRGIHRSPVNSPHKGQWRGALIFSLICVWINGWVNKRKAGDLRRYRVHYDCNATPVTQFETAAQMPHIKYFCHITVHGYPLAMLRIGCTFINRHKAIDANLWIYTEK